jgi:hypothetical protein
MRTGRFKFSRIEVDYEQLRTKGRQESRRDMRLPVAEAQFGRVLRPMTVTQSPLSIRPSTLRRRSSILGGILVAISALVIGTDWLSPLTDAQLTLISDNYGPAAFWFRLSFWFSAMGALIWLISAVALTGVKRRRACMMVLGCCGLAFAAVWRDSLLADRVEAETHIRVVSIIESYRLTR